MTGRRTSTLPTEDDLDGGVPDHDELGAEPGAAPILRIAAVEPLAVNQAQAATLIGVSKSMFHKLVSAGRIGPMGVRFGTCVRYPLEELREWTAAGMPPRHEWAARQGRSGGLK